MPRSRELRLAQAINRLASYYGQFTTGDLSRFLATRAPDGAQSTGVGQGTSTGSQDGLNIGFPAIYSQDDQLLGDLINMVIDVSDGAYLLKDMVNISKNLLNLTAQSSGEDRAASEQLRARFANYMAIVSDAPDSGMLPVAEKYQKLKRTVISHHGDLNSVAESTSTQTITARGRQPQPPGYYQLINGNSVGNINALPNPTKENPGVGIILSHTPQLSLNNRFTNAVSIFLNGVPGLEISRAVPYLDVQMIVARPATLNDQLFAPSIYKFLLGAESAPNNSHLYQLQAANSSSNVSDLNGNYTVMGMEAFTSPQVLAPTNTQDQSKRVADVIDRFQPFMSINDFTVDVVQSYGANSYRTAKLSLTLHDRSRMAEVAEFFRPDLILGTQFLIDYGWMHPDGEINSQQNNVYADLINGMRYKEKFRVTNWNFAFTDGQVKVDLDLVTVGESSFQTELFINDGVNISNTTQRLSQLVERISNLRRDVFESGQNGSAEGQTGSESGGTSRSGSRREIRGIQFLDTVNDAFNNLVLSAEQNQQMREFMAYLSNNAGIPNVSELRNAILEIYENNTAGSRGRQGGGGRESLSGQIGNQVRQLVARKLSTLKKNEYDPFLIEEDFNIHPSRTTGRVNRGAGAAAEGEISLANLLLNFIAVPLATTSQYDEIQLIFYPFNNYAGYASRLNIANFRIDVEFFKNKYQNYILSNLSRSGQMNLQQFWQFLITNILDDHGARSYGLFDGNGGLWKDPSSRSRRSESGEQSTEEEEVYDAPNQTERISCILRDVTPDGSFRLPQVSYHLETVPVKSSPYSDTAEEELYREKTILRMHIYDQAADTRGGLSQMLMAERSSALSVVPANPIQNRGANGYPALSNAGAQYTETIERARTLGLIEEVQDAPPNRRFRFRGGSREIKRFLYTVMPSITYGTNGTLIKTANVTSMQDQAANSINIINSPSRAGEAIDPNGEDSGGLPLQVIPVEASITTFGCPLISHGSQFYVDFGTGTTLDDIYQVNGVSHKIGRGEFSTTFKMVPVTGFGTYRNYLNQLRDAARSLNEIEIRRNNGAADQEVNSANQRLQQIDSNLCNQTARSRGTGARRTAQGPGGGSGGGAGGGSGGGATSAVSGSLAVPVDAAAAAAADQQSRSDAAAAQEARQVRQDEETVAGLREREAQAGMLERLFGGIRRYPDEEAALRRIEERRRAREARGTREPTRPDVNPLPRGEF